MLKRIIQRSIRLVPWRLRTSIGNLPLVGPVQRWIFSRFFAGQEFVHTVDAGPARGLRYPIQLPQDKGVWTGTYEIEFAEALARATKAGTVCFDIGGWHGFYSGVMALAGAARVHVFEPLPQNCERIRRLIALNPELDIRLIDAAVADRSGTTVFEIMAQGNMGKLSESPFDRDNRGAQQIEVRTAALDDLVADGSIEPPALLKIDVEGAEALVLRGGRELLQTYQPTLFVEIHSPELADECRAILAELGYTVSILEDDLGPFPLADPRVCHFIATASK